MGVNNLPRVATRQCTGWEPNLRPLDHKSNALTTTLPSHQIIGADRKYGKRAHSGASLKLTRMVQLPATAAIEYVAACWVSGAGGFLSGGHFVREGGLLPGGTFGLGLIPVPPSSMRIRTV